MSPRQSPDTGVVYRGPSLPDLPPEVLQQLRDAGLAVTRRGVQEECDETPRVVRQLLRSANPLRWLARLTYLSVPLRACSLDDIPSQSREAARELGFRPLIWMLHGPLLPLRTPNFIGPEGFVKLEVFGGERIYLFTYLDDGTEVETAPGKAMNLRTVVLEGTGDLARDYAAHLDCVLDLVRKRGCRPIYRATPETLVLAWRMYPAYFAPLLLHLATVAILLSPLLLVLALWLARR